MLKRICKRVKRTGSPLVQTFLYFFSLNKAQSYIVLLFFSLNKAQSYIVLLFFSLNKAQSYIVLLFCASVLVYLSNSLQVLKGAYLPLRVHSQS